MDRQNITSSWCIRMPVLDKSRLIQTVYDLVENDRDLTENDRTIQATVDALVQAFLSGLFSIRYDPEKDCIRWQNAKGQEQDSLTYEDLIQIAFKLIDSKALENAIVVLKKAVDLRPNSLEAYTLLSDVYAEQQDYENAVAQLETALHLEPKNKDLHCYLANNYAELGLD